MDYQVIINDLLRTQREVSRLEFSNEEPDLLELAIKARESLDNLINELNSY